jgi:hypothetical protein
MFFGSFDPIYKDIKFATSSSDPNHLKPERGQILAFCGNHKVRTYKEYHSVCPSSESGLPPTPHPQARVPPPPCFWGEGNTRWRERGWGGVPNPTRGIHCGTLYMYVLCGGNHSFVHPRVGVGWDRGLGPRGPMDGPVRFADGTTFNRVWRRTPWAGSFKECKCWFGVCFRGDCTANALCGEFEKNIPRNETTRPHSHFYIPVSVSDLCIPTIVPQTK